MAMINKRKITNKNYKLEDVESYIKSAEDSIWLALPLMPTIYQADQLAKILNKLFCMRHNLPSNTHSHEGQ
jgi:hypothetical protein